ncbi:hypothetical protein OROHE_021849 [Orobanche hederae]
MIPNLDLIHYACIAKGATVLAEFNSKDAALGAVAARCLDKTPPYHAAFTHTVRSRTYTFLIDEPLVYFAIFDARLETSDGLAFLKSARGAFREVFNAGQRKLEKLTSHCFQGEFNPVFRQLLGQSLYNSDGFGSPSQYVVSTSGSGPMSGRPRPDGEKMANKMKNRWLGKIKIGRFDGEKETDENGGDGIGLSREFPLISHKNGELYSSEVAAGHHNQKAKKIWKRHVWIVLSLDLVICLILFGVWLWVCSGLKCMDNT